MDRFEEHQENIKDFATVAMFNCQRMFRLLSDELDREQINEQALYGYHSMAFSAFMTMKSYYLQNNELSHCEFDSFIEKFEQFSREFVSSREINHSMQWTFGYYSELVEAYNDLANLLKLKAVEIPE